MFSFITGIAILIAMPVFSQPVKGDFKLFKFIGNTPTQFEYNGNEPKIYFNDTASFVLQYYEALHSVVLFTYKGFKLNASSLLRIDSMPLNDSYLGSLHGFFVFNEQIVVLFHSKLLLLKKTNSVYHIVASLEADYDNILTDNSGYFILCRYYNYQETERKPIIITAYQVANGTIAKQWAFKQNYNEIYYSHLSGSYLDMNNNGDLLIAFPAAYNILVFNKKGACKVLTKSLINFPDTALLNKNSFIINNTTLSIKQQIEQLMLLDVSSNRIQNIKFIGAYKFIVIRKDKELKSDYRFIDVWEGDSSANYKCVKTNLRYRNEFELTNKENDFYFNPCLSCTNRIYLKYGYLYFLDVFVPSQFFSYKSLQKLRKKLEVYYADKKLYFGLFEFKVNSF